MTLFELPPRGIREGEVFEMSATHRSTPPFSGSGRRPCVVRVRGKEGWGGRGGGVGGVHKVEAAVVPQGGLAHPHLIQQPHVPVSRERAREGGGGRWILSCVHGRSGSAAGSFLVLFFSIVCSERLSKAIS